MSRTGTLSIVLAKRLLALMATCPKRLQRPFKPVHFANFVSLATQVAWEGQSVAIRRHRARRIGQFEAKNSVSRATRMDAFDSHPVRDKGLRGRRRAGAAKLGPVGSLESTLSRARAA